MKKDFVKLAAIGLLAGFCLSAQSEPQNSEVAMSKCTKEGSPQSDKKCNGKSDCSSCSGKSGCGTKSSCSSKSDCNSASGCSSDQQSDASGTMQTKRKGAAQRVVEGE